jgi:RHS repeat-associated protein
VTSGGTTTQTRYVYDGNQIVMQFQKTGTGDLAATDLSHRYLWGPAVDQLLADEQLTPVTGGGYDLTSPGATVWTLTDNENTVRDLATYNATTGVTSVVNHREFSAYGELLSQTNPQTGQAAAVDCVFAYTGRALDEATGLQNNDERWYEAITGRWLSQDPIGFRGGINLYEYVGDSPVNGADPSGNAWHWWWPFGPKTPPTPPPTNVPTPTPPPAPPPAPTNPNSGGVTESWGPWWPGNWEGGRWQGWPPNCRTYEAPEDAQARMLAEQWGKGNYGFVLGGPNGLVWECFKGARIVVPPTQPPPPTCPGPVVSAPPPPKP